MSKKQILTLILAMTALSAQIAFAASAPSNVQNVTAFKIGESAAISWMPVQGASFYRIYYSHDSILKNEGNYDDFERTSGAETSHSFAKLPLSSPVVYFAVLAVNAEGVESEGFESEASVQQPAPAPSLPENLPMPFGGQQTPVAPVEQQPTPPAPETPVQPTEEVTMPAGENPTTTAEPMVVMGVRAVSSTGVLVTFSKAIRPDAAVNPAFFVITDSGGSLIRVNQVELNGADVLLTTDALVPGRVYMFGLVLAIPASDGTNAPAALPPIPFMGYGDPGFVGATEEGVPGPNENPQPQNQPYGQNPVVGGPGPSQQGGYAQNPLLAGVTDPAGLDLQTRQRKDGSYDIIARWIGAPGAQSYGLYTSINGQPYAWNSQVGPDQTSVQYNHVRGESFGIRVTSRLSTGQESRGLERAVNLPGSGAGIIGLAVAAGAAAGARMRRRRRGV